MARPPALTDAQISTLRDLETQVTGHPGVKITVDGTLIAKPSVPCEIGIYELVMNSNKPELQAFKKCLFTYYGTVKLMMKDETIGKDGKSETKLVEKDECFVIRESLDRARSLPLIRFLQCIVLDAITKGFRKPCVNDTKLGTILFDENASPEKKKRMERRARETTSGETGVRLNGFRVSLRLSLLG
jgi:inositol-polyphosphate multikinase